jgi:hypothetical protein
MPLLDQFLAYFLCVQDLAHISEPARDEVARQAPTNESLRIPELGRNPRSLCDCAHDGAKGVGIRERESTLVDSECPIDPERSRSLGDRGQVAKAARDVTKYLPRIR